MSTTQNNIDEANGNNEALKALADMLIDPEASITRAIAWTAKSPTPDYRCKHCGEGATVEVSRSVAITPDNDISDPEVRFVCNTCGVTVDLTRATKETLHRFFAPVDPIEEDEGLISPCDESLCSHNVHEHEHHRKHRRCKCKRSKGAREAKNCQSKFGDPFAARCPGSLGGLFEALGRLDLDNDF